MSQNRLSDVLGVGFLKKRGLPPYGKLPPLVGGGLLKPLAPAPPLPEDELVVDSRLAAALGGDDSGALN